MPGASARASPLSDDTDATPAFEDDQTIRRAVFWLRSASGTLKRIVSPAAAESTAGTAALGGAGHGKAAAMGSPPHAQTTSNVNRTASCDTRAGLVWNRVPPTYQRLGVLLRTL